MVDAVIFDKDGVLVNSERGKYDAMRRALAVFGYDDVQGLEDWFFGRVGVPGLESSEMCIKRFALSGLQARDLYDETESIRGDMLDTEPAPIIESSISFLRSLVGRVRIGVASSDFPANIKRQMEQAGVFGYIDAITSGEKNSGHVTRDKPFPDVYIAAAEKLSVSPERCLAIEDTAPGVQAAKTAGMYCIGYINPNSGNQDLSRADLRVSDLSMLDVDRLISL